MIKQLIVCDGCNEKVILSEDVNDRCSDLIGWKVVHISIEVRSEEKLSPPKLGKRLDFCPSCRTHTVKLDE